MAGTSLCELRVSKSVYIFADVIIIGVMHPEGELMTVEHGNDITILLEFYRIFSAGI